MADTIPVRVVDELDVAKPGFSRIAPAVTGRPSCQISLTDPDACSMKTRGEGIVGYSVQTEVDVKRLLFVDYEVTSAGTGRDPR